jgi:hypothetical protein
MPENLPYFIGDIPIRWQIVDKSCSVGREQPKTFGDGLLERRADVLLHRAVEVRTDLGKLGDPGEMRLGAAKDEYEEHTVGRSRESNEPHTLEFGAQEAV